MHCLFIIIVLCCAVHSFSWDSVAPKIAGHFSRRGAAASVLVQESFVPVYLKRWNRVSVLNPRHTHVCICLKRVWSSGRAVVSFSSSATFTDSSQSNSHRKWIPPALANPARQPWPRCRTARSYWPPNCWSQTVFPLFNILQESWKQLKHIPSPFTLCNSPTKIFRPALFIRWH